ncbi:SusC/RagA family TonB-linked outer membrane protein [Aquimarina sp. TRL1]|uniref:SusC/RagA family TonB-linked outer membrane protein n=1 Tax=Aquimarina sp. (strain TRL1) TaxID=2736252 RepID=UPI00158E7CB4|nr:SusC/RagA family TonB-linked outer membrane protein [Aquimarina sp. TRL1]QKX03761.1 SusC/RagA family TonB-linked outer membrane protein [Aquimarina sp. TRL1]
MNIKFSRILALFIALFLVQITFGQEEKKVSGTVTDNQGLPLPGVNIIIKNTATGTQTDFDGNYSINVNKGAVLTFSYVGFETVEKVIGDSNSVNAQLIPAASELEEVIVQAYGTTTRATSNISVSAVSAEDIVNRPNANALQTLSGQVAGLNIVAATGQPGAPPTVRVRGVGSINGNVDPLYIIDGIPTDANAFRSLNPNNIASVSVLKDAGGTAIYGNRGANGVIIITTNKGSFNTPVQVNYTNIIQFSNLMQNDYDLLDSQQQLTLERDYGALIGRTIGRGSTLTPAEIAAAETTDWADVFFDTAVTQSHNLTISNGSGNIRQFSSLGYFEQEGILENSDLKRFNIQSNVDGKSSNDKFNYGINLALNFSKSNEPNGIGGTGINRNPILGAYQSVPYISPNDYINGAALLSPLSFANTPLFILDLQNTLRRTEDEVQLLGGINASYEIVEGLTAKIDMTSEFRNEERITIESPDSFNALLFAQGKDPSGTQTITNTRQFIFDQVISLNYNKVFGKNTIDVGLFTEYFKAHYQRFGFTAEGQNPLTFAAGDDAGFIDDNADNDAYVDDIFANKLEAGLFSYFTRIDYDYDTRFGVTGTLRRDASFRFADSNRWGTFFSVSGRWNIGNESFMQESIFDALKLRASYGTTGNQFVQNDLNIPGINFDASTLSRDLFTTGAVYNGSNGIFQQNIGNNELEWETTTQLNVGLDFEIFNRRLRGSADWYQKNTRDLFLPQPISAIGTIFNRLNGGVNRFATSISANVGEIQNTGVDLSLDFDIFRSATSDGFNLSVNFVGNYNKQEVIELATPTGEIINGRTQSFREGGILNEYYTYRYAGVNPDNGNLLFLTADGEITENPDVDNDRVFLDKNIFPDFEGGFGFKIDYKGFFASTQFRYTIGVDRFDSDLQGFQDPTSLGQFRSSVDLLNAWTPTNTGSNIPRLDAANLDVGVLSDRYLTSADFLRLRFAQIGYSFPDKFLKGTGFNSIRIFANGENLFTISEWRGFDAEVVNINNQVAGNLFPTARTFSVGFEFGF